MDSFSHLDKIEPQEIIPGYKARMIHSENMTLIYWDIQAGAPLPEHQHPHEQVVNLLDGEFELVVGGKRKQLASGAVVVIPGNVAHSGHAITQCRILDVFYPVREDYQLS